MGMTRHALPHPLRDAPARPGHLLRRRGSPPDLPALPGQLHRGWHLGDHAQHPGRAGARASRRTPRRQGRGLVARCPAVDRYPALGGTVRRRTTSPKASASGASTSAAASDRCPGCCGRRRTATRPVPWSCSATAPRAPSARTTSSPWGGGWCATTGCRAVAIDGPVHGDRRADGRHRPRARLSRLRPDVVVQDPGIIDDMVGDWRATLDAVQELPDVGRRARAATGGCRWGRSSACPWSAAEPRVAVAVLGLMGIPGPPGTASPPTPPTCTARCSSSCNGTTSSSPGTARSRLFDALGSTDKRLHAHPGDARRSPRRGVRGERPLLESLPGVATHRVTSRAPSAVGAVRAPLAHHSLDRARQRCGGPRRQGHQRERGPVAGRGDEDRGVGDHHIRRGCAPSEGVHDRGAGSSPMRVVPMT